MLTLDQYITLDDDVIKSPNLCDRFSKTDLDRIGTCVSDGFKLDKASRAKWERRTQSAMDLAMQVQRDKNFPWAGCSNIAFPLITIAALSFHSRAYPALLVGAELVKCRIIGDDPTGEKTARAQRISMHMSWQVLEEDKAWEEEKDRLLINLPIVGTVFTKSYYDADKGHKVDETVLAQDLVLDYYAKSVESCPRKTHIIPFFRNEIHSRIKRKVFRDISEEAWYQQPAPAPTGASEAQRDNRRGMTPPQTDQTTPFIGLEQHVDLDLDNDGYAEPYIITVEQTTGCVLRIVTGFDRPEDIERTKSGEIISIRALQYFTKYSFIPSPDGGIYDVGFGVLLGPLNESTNSIINQLVDAGTMSITAGGFLGRGAKLRGGTYTFQPFGWQRVDSGGEDLSKSLVPLPVREPNAVLFQLLSLLINYVQRISGTTDPMVGESTGQNTPAETTRSMIQEGSRIYSGVFKRVWRCMKEEFKKGYILNGIHMPRRKSFGQGVVVLREDYLGNPDEVAPAADPNVTSEQMQMAQAQMLKAAAMQTPGYDVEAVERRYLKAIKIDGIDQIYPGIKKTGMPKDIKLSIAELKAQTENLWLGFEKQKFVMALMEEQRMNNAEIMKIMGDLEQARLDTAGDVQDRKVGMLNAMLGMLKSKDEVLMKRIDAAIKIMELRDAQAERNGGDVSLMAGRPGNGGNSRGSSAQATGAEG